MFPVLMDEEARTDGSVYADYNFELKAPVSGIDSRSATPRLVHEALYPGHVRLGSGASSMKGGQEGIEVDACGRRSSSLAQQGQARTPGGYLPYTPPAPGTAR